MDGEFTLKSSARETHLYRVVSVDAVFMLLSQLPFKLLWLLWLLLSADDDKTKVAAVTAPPEVLVFEISFVLRQISGFTASLD